jgi:hypothetical protein
MNEWAAQTRSRTRSARHPDKNAKTEILDLLFLVGLPIELELVLRVGIIAGTVAKLTRGVLKL